MLAVPEETLKKAAAGDMEAFEELYKLSSGYVYSVAYRVNGNPEDAEEVTQEVFVKVYRKLGTFSYRSKFSTWLYRVTVNTAINVYRKKAREKGRKISFDDGVEVADPKTSGSALRDLEKKDSESLVMSMLAILPEEQRACVILRDIEGLKYEEVAEAMGTNLNTVRSRLNRARAKLMAAYGKKEDENEVPVR